MLWRRENRIMMIAVTILFLAGVVNFCFAAYSGISGIKNTFSTGGINIGVEGYSMTESGEKICKPVTKVRYGGEVSYIPRITNYAEDCFVRLNLSAVTRNGEINILNYCTGINNGWIKKGDYIYYMHPLKENKSAELCDGFSVPVEWDYRSSNDMTVSIHAEAIQAKNFQPDFSSESPWGNISVKKSYITDYKTINEVVQGSEDGIKLIFEKSEDKISADRSSMFDDVALMPGDICRDKVKIYNTSSKKTEVMFKAVCEESDLMDDINLSIDNGNVFYKGNLSGEQLKEYRTIADISPGEYKEIFFKIELPEDKDNEVQLKKGQATWYFTIRNSDEVRTGDGRFLWLFGFACIISCIVILALIRKGRYEERL